jgi:alpha-L-fucosidase
MRIYLNSVGHGATWNLNVPPDRRGILHENDVASLKAFGEHLRQTFAENLAAGAMLTASNVRGGDIENFGPQKLLDGDLWSAWVTDDAITTPNVILDLKGDKTFNLIRMREDIRLGLRLQGVAVDAWQNGQWKELAKAESIGACHLWRVPTTTTSKVRIRVTQSPVCPALSDFGLYNEPEFDAWIEPIGSDPDAAVKAKWKVLSTSYTNPDSDAASAIDGNRWTIWHTYGPDGEHHLPQFIAVDMGEMTTVNGFTYTPRQDGTLHGMVDRYEFYLSNDGKNWGNAVSIGEFANLRNNPILQTVSLPHPVRARYFKFVATHAVEMDHAVIAELGIVSDKPRSK